MITSVDLIAAIAQAKKDRATKERGNAYQQLLNQFHAQVLPPFLVETQGNQTEAALLLGIHRSTFALYLKAANIDPQALAQGVTV